eukprot:433423-Rhodomonas_salina.1
MCKETTPGWFNIGSSWRISCANGGTIWSVVAMLITGLAWFGINYMASGEYDGTSSFTCASLLDASF